MRYSTTRGTLAIDETSRIRLLLRNREMLIRIDPSQFPNFKRGEVRSRGMEESVRER